MGVRIETAVAVILLIAGTALAQEAPATTAPARGPATRGARGTPATRGARPPTSRQGPAGRARNTPPTAAQTPPPPPKIAGTDLPATLLTLHYKEADSKKIFADIVSQLNLPAGKFGGDVGGEWPPVSIDVDKKPYWQVMASLSDQIKHLTRVQPDGTAEMVRRAPYVGLRYVSGPFMIVVSQIGTGVARPGTPDQLRTTRLEVTIFNEPSIKLLAIPTTAVPSEAKDEFGNSLIGDADTRISRQAPHLNDPYQFESPVVINLRPPENAGHQMAILKGILPVWIAQGSRDITIDNALTARQSTYQIAGGSLQVATLRSTGDKSFQVQVTPGTGSPDAAGTGKSLILALDVKVFDEDGKPLTIRKVNKENDRALVEVGQADPAGGPGTGPPAKIVLTVPEVLQEIDIPYEFKNLPLP